MQHFRIIILILITAIQSTQGIFNVEIITIGISKNVGMLGVLPLTAPAMDLASEEINQRYSWTLFNLSHVYLHDEHAEGCNDLLDAETFLLANYYYKTRQNGNKVVPNVTALIYPGCSDDLPLTYLTKEWNIPSILGATAQYAVRDRTAFPNILALGYANGTPYIRIMISMILTFQWRDIYVVYDSHPLKQQFRIYAMGMQTLTKVIKGLNVYMHPVLCDGQNVSFVDVLMDFHARSRILLFFGHATFTRRLLIDAAKLDMTNGRFVYFALNAAKHTTVYGTIDWQNNDADDEIARKAFESLVIAAPIDSTTTSFDMMKFRQEMQYRSHADYNYTYVSGDEVMENLLTNHTESWRLSSGAAIIEQFIGRLFHLPTGDVYVDSGGERTEEVGFWNFNPFTNETEVIWKQDPKTMKFVQVRSITWPNNNWPVLNRPVCGYSGLEGPCAQKSSSTSAIIGGVCAVLVVVAICIIILVIRIRSHDAKFNDTWWILNVLDLHFGNGQSTSGMSMLRKTQLQIDRIEFRPDAILGRKTKHATATYRTRRVFLRQLPFIYYTLPENSGETNIFFRQMLTLRHPNINNFIGLLCHTTSHISSCVYYVDEYCDRGDVNDVMANSGRLLMDLEFRCGLIRDILHGLQFIHASTLKYHGHLRSSCCLVDSRFTVKISQIAYDRLLKDVFSNNSGVSYKKHSIVPNDIWTAPEVVRDGKHRATSTADIYALGIVLQRLTTDTATLLEEEVDDDIQLTYSKRRKLQRKLDLDQFLATVQWCTADNPLARPTLATTISHCRKVAGSSDGASFLDTVRQRMERYADDLEVSVADRTRELLMERKKCDELLLEMLPQSIVTTLRHGGTVDPESFDSVSILFSDIVGFADLIYVSRPLEVVTFLNISHGLFDDIIEVYDVYKVETINDSYFVASGIPARNGTKHVKELCRMALRLLNTFSSKLATRDKEITIRIGIHTGPCVAGVVGLTRPRYCLFGDSVNTASRMLSHGQGGRIHLSSTTAQLLHQYDTHDMGMAIISRGSIEIKGKGHMDTYWLQAAS